MRPTPPAVLHPLATASLVVGLVCTFGCNDSKSVHAAGGADATPGPTDGGTGGATAQGGSGGSTGGSGGSTGGSGGSQAGSAGASGAANANEYSWDGSWTPSDSDFPIGGLLDDFYCDGHLDAQKQATPVLPPGKWDWNDADHDLANWRNFETNIGSFDALKDSKGRHFGWKLVPIAPGATDYSGPAMYFEGSSGPDWMILGADGVIHSFGNGDLADGPDVLVFGSSYSLSFRTGSESAGALRDNDLVVAGCGANPDGSYDIQTTTIHTGPGSDRVFVRDFDRSAIDLGNGSGGLTDRVDPTDGDDLVVLRGNTHDFRVFGGKGNDTFVWYVDDNVQTATWLGPNFFGGGGWDAAVWQDDGTDRLVLAIPADAPLVTATPTPPGSVMVRVTDGAWVDDPPTAGDPYAHYCVECGTSATGRKTLFVEYVSANGKVKTGYFTLTAVEELQIGVGPGARVYRLNDTTGATALDQAAVPTDPPPWPSGDCPP